MNAGTTPPNEIYGSFTIPSLEHGVVADAMHPGVFTCDAEVTLRQVARLMVTHHIHSVVVTWPDESRWGLITDVDVVGAATEDPDTYTAGQIAGSDALTIEPDQSLVRAAQVMAENAVSHLVVAEPGRRPAGVISSLDLAGILAWARA